MRNSPACVDFISGDARDDVHDGGHGDDDDHDDVHGDDGAHGGDDVHGGGDGHDGDGAHGDDGDGDRGDDDVHDDDGVRDDGDGHGGGHDDDHGDGDALPLHQKVVLLGENYDEELTKNIHSTIVEDRKAREKKQEEQKEKLRIEEREEKLRIERLRLDEQKRKAEFELEKLRIQTQSKLGADTSKESDTKFLVKEVSKFIHRFDWKENISLHLKLFERQAQRLNINQENWVSHLLGLLSTEVSHIIAREPDDKANSYEHVKDLLLKRFKLTREKFRQLFVTHQKAPERTWIDFTMS
ncbi:uncharacterized protein TNCV_2493741 [Trichonephila clavipes]|uniref:Uncharacterized protein n=1 Tax=Trichonephila clavipes TaxID=2585209 RepID=A0A8X6V4P3_TRICX|nr:uncharacterized protein TNCV_2493741 [Trichonephila clavipes]